MLVNTDYDQFRNEQIRLNSCRNRLQTLLDTCSEVVTIQTLDELIRVARGGLNGFYQLMAEKMDQPYVGGVPVSKESSLKMLRIPDETTLQRQTVRAFETLDYLQYIQLNKEEGTVEIVPGAVQALEEACSTYAETPEEADLLNALTKASDALNELQLASEQMGIPLTVHYKYTRPQIAITTFFAFIDGRYEIKATPFELAKQRTNTHIKRVKLPE